MIIRRYHLLVLFNIDITTTLKYLPVIVSDKATLSRFDSSFSCRLLKEHKIYNVFFSKIPNIWN